MDMGGERLMIISPKSKESILEARQGDLPGESAPYQLSGCSLVF